MPVIEASQVAEFQSKFGTLLDALVSEYDTFVHVTGGLANVADAPDMDVPSTPIGVCQSGISAPKELDLCITPTRHVSSNMGPSPPLPLAPYGEQETGNDCSARDRSTNGSHFEVDCFEAPPEPTSDLDDKSLVPGVNLKQNLSEKDAFINHSSALSSASVCYRLQARLGMADWNGMVTAQDLHIAVVSLGLMKYEEYELEKLIGRMAKLCRQEDGYVPTPDPKPASLLTRAGSVLSSVSLITGSTVAEEDRLISVHALSNFLVSSSERKQLGPEYENMVKVIKEVLLSGDANRLVAELTSVRVDDLAAPPPRMDWDLFFEPLIAFVILLNGISIGLQTEEDLEKWKGWPFVEFAFTLFYSTELVLRIWFSGCRKFYRGSDWFWGVFDTIIVLFALADTVIDFFFSNYALNMTTFTIIRTVRLTRLTRLLRIFRFGILRDLTIMIKGLVAGCRTLIWANLLLFFTIYIVGVFATFTIGRRDANLGPIVEDELFSSVPRAMLTSFRCFVGDCTTSQGEPIVKILSDRVGVLFVLGYLVSFTVVTLGLFNLITAIYVEIAVAAAKKTEELDKRRAHRESLRIAHIAKNLLKKFCIAQRHFSFAPATETTAEDQEVQRLMNELDIPPDRANLFDVLDADGTGDLHVTEVVHGLLQIRGEARKSDVIASLLAVRAVQEMIRLMETRLTNSHERIMLALGIEKQVVGERKSIWDRQYNSSSMRLSQGQEMLRECSGGFSPFSKKPSRKSRREKRVESEAAVASRQLS